jgi:NTP pyrophosphatase (non-canonical NTP hydrolase)
MFDSIKFYIHKKSGKLYEMISPEIINATNANDGQILVLYKGRKKDDSGEEMFTREYNEFNDKFRPLGVLYREELEIIIKEMANDSIAEKLGEYLKVNPSISCMGLHAIFDEFDLSRIKDIIKNKDIIFHIDIYLNKLNSAETITSSNFVEKAIRTESNNMDDIISRITNHQFIRLLHAGMGLTTEIGEFIDALKRYLFYGEDLDISNMKEESGDLMWYIAILVHTLKSNMDDIMTINIGKLKARYPHKFNKKDALIRDLENELKFIQQ